MIKKKFLYLLAFLLISAKLISAQQKANGLVISEVYLDKDIPTNSWVEIYNPTKETLSLEKFSLSTIGPANLLDASIIKNGGIKLDPGDFIILCCEQNKTLNNKEKVFNVKFLNYLSEGGIITVITQSLGIEGVDLLRYGNSSLTLWDGVSDKQVIPFSLNGKSYSRKDNSKNVGKDFYESELTPLGKNK